MKEEFLDCKQLKCPMPIVKISRAIKGLEVGQRLVVEASDPAFQADLEAWSKKMKHKLIEFDGGEVQRAVIEKS